ncbi:hypothetical protein HDV05_005648 [Chytridiales sp. JEL 0842]|nr:hypothetical protein HDV05_005648 [Chytridiales sp. JEL 0842]
MTSFEEKRDAEAVPPTSMNMPPTVTLIVADNVTKPPHNKKTSDDTDTASITVEEADQQKPQVSDIDRLPCFQSWPMLPKDHVSQDQDGDSFLQKLAQALISRKAQDVIKASFALLLALTFSFWSTSAAILPARTHANVLLVAVALSPAQTIGQFMDATAIAILGLAISSGAWAFINTVAELNYPAYNACSSAVGINGPNTSGGNVFDRNFLRDTIYSYCMGLGISMFACFFIFPDFAHTKFKRELSFYILHVSKLLATINQSFNPENPERPSNDKVRTDLIKTIRESQERLTTLLFFTEREPYFSRYSVEKYKLILTHVTQSFALLASLDTALQGQDDILRSTQFRGAISQVSAPLRTVETGLLHLLRLSAEALQSKSPQCLSRDMECNYEEDTQKDLESVKAALSVLREKLTYLVARVVSSSHKKEEMLGVDSKSRLMRGTLIQEELFLLNYILLNLTDCLKDVEAAVHVLCNEKEHQSRRRLWFHAKVYIPTISISVFKVPAKMEHLSAGVKFKRVLLNLYKFAMACDSIYALKGAIAVLIYQLVMLNQPAFYRQWGLQSSFVSFLVAIAPSVGLSNVTFVINIVCATVGNAWAFFALSVWGTGFNPLTNSCSGWGCSNPAFAPQVGLGLWSLLLAVPMVYIMVCTPLKAVGLLTLLTYGNALLASWLNRLNPNFDGFYVRFYKNVAGTAMAVTFAMFFSLFLYPTLARRLIRIQLSDVIRRINDHYFDCMSAFYHPSTTSQKIPKETQERLRKDNNSIATTIQSLRPLLIASAAEVRLEGRFKLGVYREVLCRLTNILDYLRSARVCMGDMGLDYNSDPLFGEVRRKVDLSAWETRETVRLLLYIYSTSLVAKHPLPHELPSAVAVRNRIFEEYNRELEMLRVSMDRGEIPTEVNESDAAKREEEEIVGRMSSSSFIEPVRDNNEVVLSTAPKDLERSSMESRPSSRASNNETRVNFSIVPAEKRLSRRITASPMPKDPEELRKMVASESWLRFLSYAVAMRMFTIEIDSLASLLKELFDEIPNLNPYELASNTAY